MQLQSMYSPSDVRGLLEAFYSLINPEKLSSVDSIVEEMESRIASRSGHGERRQEMVYSEITRLNQRLRETYGKDLSVVMPDTAQQLLCQHEAFLPAFPAGRCFQLQG